MRIEVVYAKPDHQVVEEIEVPSGCTIAEAVRRSGLLDRFPEIDLADGNVGVFGRRRRLAQTLEPGDRVEIYRPLQVDPREARRRRARRRER